MRHGLWLCGQEYGRPRYTLNAASDNIGDEGLQLHRFGRQAFPQQFAATFPGGQQDEHSHAEYQWEPTTVWNFH
ncbi:hypothetical protein D3C80_2192750 [compost metagenome]